MTNEFDILIIGGGLVGASLACALGGQDLRVGLVEVKPFATRAQSDYDERSIALSYGSQRIFAAMGLWPALADSCTPIQHIQISDRGHFGAARLDADEEGVAALGYVAPARVIGQALVTRLAEFSNIELLCPAQVAAVRLDTDAAQVSVQIGETARLLRSRLVVAADGAHSLVREQLGIETAHWQYDQTAVIANITPERPHANTAYERFTDTGPLALLPMHDDRCALVWTVRTAQVDALMQLDDAEFLAALQERFGQRLGRLLKVGTRQAYPLNLVRTRESVRARLALIGNAAHSLHPVAGQGFNLGLRDVAALVDVLVEALHDGVDIGNLAVLQRYAAARRRDQRGVIAFTDGLARIFANPLAPVALARNLGLIAVDLLPPCKHFLSRRTMGLAGRLPRLARGLSL
jgi:2-octaprenyl-6-methoxyphenol hydroxylase